MATPRRTCREGDRSSTQVPLRLAFTHRESFRASTRAQHGRAQCRIHGLSADNYLSGNALASSLLIPRASGSMTISGTRGAMASGRCLLLALQVCESKRTGGGPPPWD
ncbi:hypothetical protein C8T65DRAFT_663743 [Cerioporus squamosus]|nr:hypothetical protein C8T65DRAFT_663743 [Cerioporus squamosus]